MRIDYERRRARKGKGFLPGNPDQWTPEHNALDVRADFDIPLSQPLPIRKLLKALGAVVVPHGRLPCAESILQALRADFAAAWSAIALPWPGAKALVVFNDAHSSRRRRASLAEEFFHLWLGHPMTTLRCYEGGTKRTFAKEIEREAYDSGAAALVPYKLLRTRIEAGCDARRIAEYCDVSMDLVEYRAKVTKLYRRLRTNDAA